MEVTEKTFGIDNINMISTLSTLGGYYYENQNLDKGIQCLLQALYLSDLVGGEYNNESMRLLEELHILYLEAGDIQESISAYHEKLERCKRLFEEKSPVLLVGYQKLGFLYLKNEDFQTALDYFFLRLQLLKKVSKNDQNALKYTQNAFII